jgi:hypothetical protein
MRGTIGYFPQFVTLNGQTCLRLIYGNGHFSYYRDGGAWEVDFEKLKDGSLISASHIPGLSGCHLRSVTESKWRKDNAQYAPDNFPTYGWNDFNQSTNPCAEIDLPKDVKENYEYLLIRR